MSARYLESHPELAQKFANAFVRTLKFINTHSVADIAKLVPEMTAGANQAPSVLREGVKMFATDGLMPAAAARAEADVVAAQFPEYKGVRVAETFTNQFVEKALARTN